MIEMPTRKQLELLPLLAEGKTYKEIAALKFRSPGTIRNHIEDMRERVGARNIAHLVAIAFREGLLRSVLLLVLVSQSLPNGAVVRGSRPFTGRGSIRISSVRVRRREDVC